MFYNSTQDKTKAVLSAQAIAQGISQDGGLFVPESFPQITEEELKAMLSNYGIGLMAWYPLGHGDRSLIEEPVFAELGKKYGKTSAQIILRWHIQSGNVIIPGSRNTAHIRDNFDVFDFELTDEEMARIAELDKGKRYYNGTWEQIAAYKAWAPDFDAQE